MVGRKAKGRELVEKEKIIQLREYSAINMANFGIKNDDIGGENSYTFKESYYIAIR